MSARFCEGCGKDGYRTYGAASSAAQHCHRKRDVPLRVYYSDICCSYHLTSRVAFEVAA